MPEMNPRWTAADLPDLDGATVLITGANSGLGLESARALAAHGAQVLMAGRNPQKLSQAASTVTGGPRPVTVQLDLADLGSVRRGAQEVTDRVGRLDVLMNNAGVMAPPLLRTKDGFESQIGVNHLGHFALTGLLLPLLRQARVVTVSSTAHRMGSVNVDDLNYEHRSYSSWPAYGQSKVANLLFTAELDRRARAAGWELVAVAAHPGYAATNLQTSGPWYAQNPVGRLASQGMNLLLGQSAEHGAWPQLYAAAGPDVEGDDFFGPSGWRGLRGHPARSSRSAAAGDTQVAGALWEVSQALTGVVYDFSRPTGESLS
jgi:NAD(P)-dependent dehydrogenase (short-subunit alcohol dehydrogenase family)